mmetsp:Transcript_22445/g.67194  ORF Transcript_22445/g.67194 Transcript_22445/m.67194 type:complete len:638 (+) Transcript_22445:1310-3223(+)
MCAKSAVTTDWMCMAWRMLDLSSPSNGFATVAARSTSARKASMLSLASCTSFWATNRCSRSVHCFDNFANSTWHCVKRDCNLDKSANVDPRPLPVFLASWTRIARNFRASATAACASASTAPISSHTALASLEEMSPSLSSGNFVIVSASRCTAACTLATFSPDTWICVERFRSAVSFFSSASFDAPTSKRAWRAASSLVHASAGACENSLMSTSFCTTNVRAAETAFCPVAAAASQAATPAVASAAGSDSKPFKKGNSASLVLLTALSAASTCAVASATISAHCKRSFCSLEALVTSANFLSATVIFALMATNSSLRNPDALLSFTSTSLAVVLNFVDAEPVAFSMRSTCSGCGSAPSRPAAAAAAATLSTSASVVESREATSCNVCLTRSRSSASLVVARSFAISCCTLFTRVCKRPNSLPEPAPPMASFLRSAVRWRRSFRATTRLACAARSATLACSTASRPPSVAVSPGAPIPPNACDASAKRTASSSAAFTLVSTSSNKCPRLRSALLARNCCSLLRPSSKRFCIMSISSLTVLAGPSENRATSTSFRATNVCASAIVVCTFEATSSACANNLSKSCGFCSPRKKGSSASDIFCSSSSAADTFSDTSRRRRSAATRIWVSLTVLRTSSNFS